MSNSSNQPIVSILSPCYNVEKYLPQCLDSIINQTYQNLQIVMIDDGSKDNTWNILKEYAAKDSRIEIYHQKNQGVATTRNNLLSEVKGEYILFVDSDDWCEIDMISELVTHALEECSDFVMCDRVMNDNSTNISEIKTFSLTREQAVRDFLHHDYFAGSLWNKLISSKLTQGITFHKDIWYGEDALFCWGVLQNVNKVVVTNEKLYHYRQNFEGITYQSFNYRKLTGHQTWEIITDDVRIAWPQFYDLSRGTFARSDFHLLRAAAQSGYSKDDHIRLLQSNLRTNYQYLRPLLKGFKQTISASLIRYWYGYGKFYYRLYNLKNK
ncbi:glycosyltransferase family 2 protein [Bacteroides sp.]